jgi:hypothetical protein
MPRCFPIATPVEIRASASDMVGFRWNDGRIEADFVIPSAPTSALRVSFDTYCIVRILDEMPLSTEEDTGPRDGGVAEQFAYRVEGAAFEAAQSPAWKEVFGPVSHWQFITGSACLDVLSRAAPTFSVVPRLKE